jgi:hypothetical protein
MLTESEWDRLSALLDKIINAPGTWPDKRLAVERELGRREADFEEFINWWDGEPSEGQ